MMAQFVWLVEGRCAVHSTI